MATTIALSRVRWPKLFFELVFGDCDNLKVIPKTAANISNMLLLAEIIHIWQTILRIG